MAAPLSMTGLAGMAAWRSVSCSSPCRSIDWISHAGAGRDLQDVIAQHAVGAGFADGYRSHK